MLKKLRERFRRDDGMATAEYAVGIVAAVGFALVLAKIVNGGAVAAALTAIITRALAKG